MIYFPASIAISEDLINEINSLIYCFIWEGGLKMFDIQSMIRAEGDGVLKFRG